MLCRVIDDVAMEEEHKYWIREWMRNVAMVVGRWMVLRLFLTSSRFGSQPPVPKSNLRALVSIENTITKTSSGPFRMNDMESTLAEWLGHGCCRL